MEPIFCQRLERIYSTCPDKPALHLLFANQPEQQFSYRQLLHQAGVFSTALQKAGIAPGEVVILILQHGQELIFSFFGAILSGAVPSIMPFLTEKLLPDQYRSSLEALFKITKPAAVITYADFLSEVTKSAAGSSVRKILISEEITKSQHSATQNHDAALEISHLPGAHCKPADIVLLQHSSGTTGLQKGVALSHQAVFNQLSNYSQAINFTAEDVVVSWLPLYHDMGLIAGFLMPLLLGSTLVLMSPFEWVRAPYRLFQAITKFKGSLCWLPNFAYNFCAQKIRQRDLVDIDLTSLRAVINCSEPMYWKSHQMFLERFSPFGLSPNALATSYAMAENVFAVTQGGIHSPVMIDCIEAKVFSEKRIARPVNEPREQIQALSSSLSEQDNGLIMYLLSAGKTIPGTSISIVDNDGTPLPERHIGRIVLKSDCMLSEYYHRQDLTEKAFLDGWYVTGDLGYLANGELYVTGREKDLIIVGGKNVYPQDLERLAEETKGVYPGRVVALGVYNERNGTEDVVLIAEVENEASTEAVASEIRARVTRGSDISLRFVHIVPRNWLVKTSSGKIARSANREKFLIETISHD